jgi:inosine-uridine nucleoside N-ribohydrolase
MNKTSIILDTDPGIDDIEGCYQREPNVHVALDLDVAGFQH